MRLPKQDPGQSQAPVTIWDSFRGNVIERAHHFWITTSPWLLYLQKLFEWQFTHSAVHFLRGDFWTIVWSAYLVALEHVDRCRWTASDNGSGNCGGPALVKCCQTHHQHPVSVFFSRCPWMHCAPGRLYPECGIVDTVGMGMWHVNPHTETLTTELHGYGQQWSSSTIWVSSVEESNLTGSHFLGRLIVTDYKVNNRKSWWFRLNMGQTCSGALCGLHWGLSWAGIIALPYFFFSPS